MAKVSWAVFQLQGLHGHDRVGTRSGDAMEPRQGWPARPQPWGGLQLLCALLASPTGRAHQQWFRP